MTTVNFKESMPEFGTPNHNDTTIQTKRPYDIFTKQKTSKGTTLLNIKCSCGDPVCKNKVSFYYDGLNHYSSLKNLGSDTQVTIQTNYKKDADKAENVMWNPSDENIAEFIDFSNAAQEAIAFKQELLQTLYAQLQVRIKGCTDIQILVRKEKSEIRFILFEIPNTLPNVPLLCESKDYLECLGIIATLPADTDTSKIKNDTADMTNPFFAPVIAWVKLLGEENQQDLEIHSIWVMPE